MKLLHKQTILGISVGEVLFWFILGLIALGVGAAL